MRRLTIREKGALLRYCPSALPNEPKPGARLLDLDEYGERGSTLPRAVYHAWFAENVEHSYYPKDHGPNPYRVGDAVEVMAGGHYGRGEPATWHKGIVTKAGAWYEHYHTHVAYEGANGGGGHMMTFATSRTLRPAVQPVSRRKISID